MVPHLCTGPYDNGPFSSFPERQDWEVRFYTSSIEEGVTCSGKTPSVQITQAFLQTWLYFGTLYEIFGPSVDMSDFVTSDSDGNRFLSTVKLRQAMNKCLVASVKDTDPNELQRKDLLSACTRIRSHLDTLYGVLSGMRELVDPGTLAATAILGESVENLVCSLHLTVLDIETPIHLPWGTMFSRWLIEHLKFSGWCPSSISRFAMSNLRISVLYYYCHMPPSLPAKDHSACDASSCSAVKINPRTYRVAHTTVSCDCPELKLDVESIDKSLRNKRLPLVEISPNAATKNTRIIFREDDGKTGFVAISHVWADGLGNPKNNSLPACSLQELSRLVGKLPTAHSRQSQPVPFWIDTICVPIEPANLKQLALNYLRHPYMHAEHVLVLDNYLRTLDSKDCDILEIFARASCGNWISRLWTLQEGRLAKRVWIQFRDKAIELKALWDAYKRENIKGIDYWSMLLAVVSKWYASDVLGPTGPKVDIAFLREVLCFRSVSVPADEALCLFCLAGLDMTTIASVPASVPLRMKTFWSKMHTVPSSFVFSKHPQKLNERGFRWAPSTFMGALPRNHWAGKVKEAENLAGIPTPRGLLVKSPGYICIISWDRLEDWGGMVFKGGANWFTLCLEEPWHASSASVPHDQFQKMAIILEKFPWNKYIDGVIGYVAHEEVDTTYVKCLQHMALYKAKSTEERIFEAAFNYVSIDTPFPTKDPTAKLDQEAVRMTKAYLDTYPAFSSTCHKWLLGSKYVKDPESFAALLVEMMTCLKRGGSVDVMTETHSWCVD